MLARIQMQHVPDILVFIPELLIIYISEVVLIVDHRLLPLIGLRKHIQGDKINPSVIVEVGRIVSHGELALMGNPLRAFVGEGSVPVVDVQHVVGDEIIPYVNVGPSPDFRSGKTVRSYRGTRWNR